MAIPPARSHIPGFAPPVHAEFEVARSRSTTVGAFSSNSFVVLAVTLLACGGGSGRDESPVGDGPLQPPPLQYWPSFLMRDGATAVTPPLTIGVSDSNEARRRWLIARLEPHVHLSTWPDREAVPFRS